MRTLPLLCATVLFAACQGPDPVLPDGGRMRQVCSEAQVVVPVRVVNLNGEALQTALVTATNVGSPTLTQSGPTDARGYSYVVTDDLAPGTVRVTVSWGNKLSPPAEVNFVCGDCTCAANPPNVTITMP